MKEEHIQNIISLKRSLENIFSPIDFYGDWQAYGGGDGDCYWRLSGDWVRAHRGPWK